MIMIAQKSFDSLSAVNRNIVSKCVVSSSVISQNLFEEIIRTAFSLC